MGQTNADRSRNAGGYVMDFHNLFQPQTEDDEIEPEEVATIGIERLETAGVFKIATLPAASLPDEDALYRLVGGGRYRLTARRPGGQIITKRELHFDGPKKPAKPPEDEHEAAATEPAPAPAAAPAAAGGIDQAGLFAMLMANMQKSQDTMTAVLMAALTGKTMPTPPASADPLQQMSHMMALINGMKPPAPAVTPLKEQLEINKMIRDAGRESAALMPLEAPTDTAGTIKSIIEAVAPVILLAGANAGAPKV